MDVTTFFRYGVYNAAWFAKKFIFTLAGSEGICILWTHPSIFIFSQPEYMPPEVFCDSTIETDDHVETDIVTEPCGPKTDIWSLGLILLEVFTVSVC